MRRRLPLIAVLLAGVAAALLVVLGGSDEAGEARVARAEPPRAAPPQAVEAMAPIPKARPKLVEPVAGEGSGAAEPEAVVEDDLTDGEGDAKPTRAASTSSAGGRRGGGGGTGDAVTDATALPNGVALPPLEAPEEVLKIIQAGNTIAKSPYKWGGGHGKWQDTGYDCSGSVSYALASAGLMSAPLASGPFMKWGKPGRGKWVTIYTNPGHMFMEVAGIRFDTSGARVTGSRWQNAKRSTGGFVARHPPGL